MLTPRSVSSAWAYAAWSAVAFAYVLAFLQRVSPQAITSGLIQDFSTDAAGVALLVSGYFWGYTVMQVPAGILVDRYGVKRIVLLSLLASSLGSAAFAFAPNLTAAFAARCLVACGDALIFTALLKLTARQFSDRRFGLMSGVSQVSGYVGGAIATVPLAAAATGFGWRACFVLLAGLGAVNLVAAAFAIKTEASSTTSRTMAGVASAGLAALSQRAAWGCAMTFASHFAVVTTLSGVWGLPMVAHFFGVTPAAAGVPLMAFMAGNAVGSLALGHAADRIAALDAGLIRVGLCRMALTAMLLPPLAHAFGPIYVTTVFALLGLVAGGTVPLVLKCTRRLYTAELIGVGASVNTTTAGLLVAVAQPVIGYAMVTASGAVPGGGALAIDDAGYSAMLVLLLLLSLPGIAGPMLMRRNLTTNPSS